MRSAFLKAIINKYLQHYNIDKNNIINIITPDIFDIILNNIENTCGIITKKDYEIIISYLEK